MLGGGACIGTATAGNEAALVVVVLVQRVPSASVRENQSV